MRQHRWWGFSLDVPQGPKGRTWRKEPTAAFRSWYTTSPLSEPTPGMLSIYLHFKFWSFFLKETQPSSFPPPKQKPKKKIRKLSFKPYRLCEACHPTSLPGQETAPFQGHRIVALRPEDWALGTPQTARWVALGLGEGVRSGGEGAGPGAEETGSRWAGPGLERGREPGQQGGVAGNPDWRSRTEAPPPPPTRPLVPCKRDAGGEHRGRGSEKERRRVGEEEAAALERFSQGSRTQGARTLIPAALPPAESSLLTLTMSQSRHRAAAPPLEREDSGTFRSAHGRSSCKWRGGGGCCWAGGGGRPGSPAALWVKPLPDALAPLGCRQAGWHSAPPSWRRPGRGLRPGPAPPLLHP